MESIISFSFVVENYNHQEGCYLVGVYHKKDIKQYNSRC